MAKVSKVEVGLQSGTDRSVYGSWEWTKEYTKEYTVDWTYATGDGIWFTGSKNTVTVKNNVYSAPENATKVRVRIKPVAKTYKVNGKDTARWTAEWSSYATYSFKNNPPAIPSVPTVSVENSQKLSPLLVAEVDVYDTHTSYIEFQIVKNDKSTYATKWAPKTKNHASISVPIALGNEYKVRCRGMRMTAETVTSKPDKDGFAAAFTHEVEEYSAWSEYSQNVGTVPAAPKEIKEIRALSATSARLAWSRVSNASAYEIEYTTEKRYFDSSSQTQTLSVTTLHAEVTGLETGTQWFFRVRAQNDVGESAWCDNIVSIVLGQKPAAPSTWSSTATVTLGQAVTLYWIHNTQDGSAQKEAKLEYTVKYMSGGVIHEIHHSETIEKDLTGKESDTICSYKLSTGGFPQGTVSVSWSVATKGIYDKYSPFSASRIIEVYAPVVLDLETNFASVFESFPLNMVMSANVILQKVIGYTISITSLKRYSTTDEVGRTVIVNKNDDVYSKYLDTSKNPISISISAGEVSLENNVTYSLKCIVSMDSGLTASAEHTFTVSYKDHSDLEPDAEIAIDLDTMSAIIHPYCNVSGMLLSVYRKEFDGTFVELLNDFKGDVFIVDLHPPLDYARYRIIAKSPTTGEMSFYDMPAVPIGGKEIILQWDEEPSFFFTEEENEMDESPLHNGSMIKLPYNIDVSNNYGADVELIKYAGRRHPVSYYGTHVDETAVWNTVILADDEETLYGLRRLAVWMGDVYVREPSGSGYLARVEVSFSQKHCDMTIPVTLNITRVSGGD